MLNFMVLVFSLVCVLAGPSTVYDRRKSNVLSLKFKVLVRTGTRPKPQ